MMMVLNLKNLGRGSRGIFKPRILEARNSRPVIVKTGSDDDDNSKGLEFPLVFLAGMEDGLFPHTMSMEEPGRLEEERRLCYVGITRAMRKLYLTYAESRRIHGNETMNRPSRFISEIPEEVVKEVRMNNTVVLNTPKRKIRDGAVDGTELRLGQRVIHEKFGEGVILNYEGNGTSARVQVNFSSGSKWLVVAYANLKAVG